MGVDVDAVLRQLGVDTLDLDDCARCDEDIELPKMRPSMPVRRGF